MRVFHYHLVLEARRLLRFVHSVYHLLWCAVLWFYFALGWANMLQLAAVALAGRLMYFTGGIKRIRLVFEGRVSESVFFLVIHLYQLVVPERSGVDIEALQDLRRAEHLRLIVRLAHLVRVAVRPALLEAWHRGLQGWLRLRPRFCPMCSRLRLQRLLDSAGGLLQHPQRYLTRLLAVK